MPAVSTDLYTWSSTAGSNNPVGTDVIGSTLDDNLRAIQAGIKGALDPLSSVAGTNTITATGAQGLTAYASGQKFTLTPASTNTGVTTLNITPSGGSALGAKHIFINGADLVGGELVAGIPYLLSYDGTQFNVIGDWPRFKIGSFTRDISLASGSQAVTGVGFQPKAVVFLAVVDGDSKMSMGFDNAVAALAVYWNNAVTASSFALASSSSIKMQGTTGNFTTGVLASLDAGGFTVTWTKTGSPTGTATVLYLALM